MKNYFTIAVFCIIIYIIGFVHNIKGEDYLERDRSIKWGPRTIDLDIIFFDDYVYSSDKLTIPHVDMQNRMFVLEPLSQLCPGYRHPVLGKTVSQLREELIEKGGMDDIIEHREWPKSTYQAHKLGK